MNIVLSRRIGAVLLSIGAHAGLLALLPKREPPKPPPIAMRMLPRAPRPEAPPPPPSEPAIAPPTRGSASVPRRAPAGTVAMPPPAPAPAASGGEGPSTPWREASPEEGGVLAPTRPPGVDLAPSRGPPGPEVIVRMPQGSPGRSRVPGLSPKAGGGYEYRDRGFDAEIHPDGSVEFGSNKAPVGLFGESAGGEKTLFSVDITEAVMMLAGDDPYRADKELFLRATQELRLELCAKDHQERLEVALFELADRLRQVWGAERDAELKRRTLFQLWDECLEPQPHSTDLAERTGAQARATILSFIQRNLPADSAAAYPAHELLALNQKRRSRAMFDPYGTLTDAGTCQ